MNILIPDSWLREYLETPATPKQIKDCLSLCGPSVERVEQKGNDQIFEIEITSNRVDMASVLGIAREVAAILPRFAISARLKDTSNFSEVEESDSLPLTISDPDHLCYRVLAVVMDNVEVSKSPDLICERLEKSGVRPLNNLIDITNYVMLELGHPTHVFDYDRIKTGKLMIRRAKKGEKIITLDGKEGEVDERDVVIDDGTGRIVDLPGIMGTENSVVTDETKRIVFFIESNNPVNIRGTSMRLGLRTMAATINEKHPDPESAYWAMLRGIGLYKTMAGAKIKSKLIDIYHAPQRPKKIKTTIGFINERLGIELRKNEIFDILKSLSFKASDKNTSEGISVTPPSFRQFDVIIPEDIVEEVARIYGYHNLPSRLMTGEIPVTDSKNSQFNLEEKIKTILKYWGYTEVYHYSFTSRDLIEKAGLQTQNHLKIANPLTSEIEYMRTSLFPPMLNTLVQNQDQKENLQLFELAKVYLPQKSDLPKEPSMLLIINNLDFYLMKGLVESLLSEIGLSNYQLSPNQLSLLHPNISLEFWTENITLAWVGKLHPQLSSRFGLRRDVYAAYLSLSEIAKRIKPVKLYQPIPLYPKVVEDLTFVLPKKAKIGPIISEIEKIPLVIGVEIRDRFNSQLTLKIVYQDRNKNLHTSDVKKIREKIIATVKSKFNASLKG